MNSATKNATGPLPRLGDESREGRFGLFIDTKVPVAFDLTEYGGHLRTQTAERGAKRHTQLRESYYLMYCLQALKAL
jgi:hypothetical protein